MSQVEVMTSINKCFWFEKESKAGNLDKISGQVVHPPMDDIDGNQVKYFGDPIYGAPSGSLEDTKELRIDGCNYNISEHKIIKWIELDGDIRSDITLRV